MRETTFEARFRKSTCNTPTMSTNPAGKCPICGKNKRGKLNCCVKGGSWQGRCGDPGKKKYTWDEGAKACQNAVSKPTTIPEKCRKCGKTKRGLNCCAKGGSWQSMCGDGDKKEYTWDRGAKACQNVVSKPTEIPEMVAP